MAEGTQVISRSVAFLKTDLWRERLSDLPFFKRLWLKYLRIFILTGRGFQENNCPLRASALTFYTLLSIVPVAAMAFGIAKGFGFEKTLSRRLLESFPGQEEVIGQIINFANSMLENTKGGMIAGIGVIVLFWAVIKVLGHIEDSFNHIWGIEESRSWARKFSDYLAIMIISPVLFIMSSSITVFITTQVMIITEQIALLGLFSPIILFLLKLLPYCLIWILFTFNYMILPNTRANFLSALQAGILAGTIYQIAQWAYITFQVGVSKYNAIYGSFAALPLFLVWLNISWLIVLFGAVFAATCQNIDKYEFWSDCQDISLYQKNIFYVQVAHLLVQDFKEGNPPINAEAISSRLEIPLCLATEILKDLRKSGIIRQVLKEDGESMGYQPARDPEAFTISHVLDLLEQSGKSDPPSAPTAALEVITEALDRFRAEREHSSSNRKLKDIQIQQ